MTEFSRAMDVRAMMHHHPFWIEIFIYFFTLVLPKFPLRTKSRENLKGDFFAYICTQRERDAEKKREKALERERRKETERSTKSFVSRTFVSTEFGAIPGRARSRVGWFLAGGFARGFFFFFFSRALCPAREVTASG